MKRIDEEGLAWRIRAHAAAELREGKIGGKEIVVCQNGRRVYHGAFGAAADRQGRPNNAIYRLASMTKPVTAAAVLQLWDRGLLDLQAPAALYYPELAHMEVATVRNGAIVSRTPAKNGIRVSDLLSHTSGIGCAPVAEILGGFTARLTLREAIGAILSAPLSFEPRTAQAYCPTAPFDLAAGIVEQVSGTAFDEYLRKNLFGPLHMTDATFAPTPAQQARTAPMFDRTEAGACVVSSVTAGCVFENYIPERLAAGAGLAATAEDYVRFAEMLCSGGLAEDGTRVFSERAVRLLAAPNVPETVEMGCERWGLGVRVVAAPGYPHGLGVGCFGWSGAYGTHFWVDPENRISAVMMKNNRYDGGAGNRSACELERDVTDSLV